MGPDLTDATIGSYLVDDQDWAGCTFFHQSKHLRDQSRPLFEKRNAVIPSDIEVRI
jgi:hypothetical protein